MKRCHNFSLQMKSGNVRSTFCTSAFCSLRRWLLTKRGDGAVQCSGPHADQNSNWDAFGMYARGFWSPPPHLWIETSPSHWSIYVMLCSGGTIPKVGGFTELSPCTSRWDPFQFPKQQHRWSGLTAAEPRQGLSIDRHRLSVVQIYNLIDRMVVQYIILMMSIGQWQKCSTVLIGLLLRIWKLSYIPVLNVRLLLFRCHSETMLSLQWDDYGASSFFSTYCCCCLE